MFKLWCACTPTRSTYTPDLKVAHLSRTEKIANVGGERILAFTVKISLWDPYAAVKSWVPLDLESLKLWCACRPTRSTYTPNLKFAHLSRTEKKANGGGARILAFTVPVSLRDPFTAVKSWDPLDL